MRELYIKTAEEMAKSLEIFLMLTSDDYKKRYLAMLEAEDRIRAKIKTQSMHDVFEKLVGKNNEKLNHELMRAMFVSILPERKKPLFTMNERYILRNGEILELRNKVYASLFPDGDCILKYEEIQKKVSSFYLGKADEYISVFFKSAYDYFC